MLIKNTFEMMKGIGIMKENAILKINKMGKVGYILSNICKVFLAIAAVLAVVCIVCLAVVPKDFVTLQFGGNAKIDVNMEKFGGLTDEMIAELNNDSDMVSVGMDIDGMSYDNFNIEADNNHIYMDGSAQIREFRVRDFIPFMGIALLRIGLAMITVCFVGALCKAFKNCASPFEENVIVKMKNLAIAIIPWGIVNSVENSFLNTFMSGKVNLSFGIDLGMVAAVIIILAIMYVFKYGAMLQQESDETL